MTDPNLWKKAGEPLPIGAIRVSSGTCAYNCDKPADYLVKIENNVGETTKFRICEDCDKENQIWAERHLPETNSTV